MKKIQTLLFLTALFALSGSSASDTTTTWINTPGEVVDKETAPFYRLGWEADGKWQTLVYFRFGPLYESACILTLPAQ